MAELDGAESAGTAPWSPRRRAPSAAASAPATAQDSEAPRAGQRRGAPPPGPARRGGGGGGGGGGAEAGQPGAGAPGGEAAARGAAGAARQAKEARLRNVLAAWLARRPGAAAALHDLGELYREQPAVRVEIRSVGGLQMLIEGEPRRFAIKQRPGSEETVSFSLNAPASAAAPPLSTPDPLVSAYAPMQTPAGMAASASASASMHGLEEIKRQLYAELDRQDDRLRAHDTEFASAAAGAPPAAAAAATDPAYRAAAQLARWLESRPGQRCAAIDMPLFFADPAHAEARAAIRSRTLLAFLRTYSAVFDFSSSGSAVIEVRLRHRPRDPEQEWRVCAAESAWTGEALSSALGPAPSPTPGRAPNVVLQKRRAPQLQEQAPARAQVAEPPILAAVAAAAEAAASQLLSQVETESALASASAALKAGANSPRAASRSSIARLIERFRTAPPTEPDSRSSIVDLVWWSKAASPASGSQPRAPSDHPEAQQEQRHRHQQQHQQQQEQWQHEQQHQQQPPEQQQQWPREVAIADPLPALYPELRLADTSAPSSPSTRGGTRALGPPPAPHSVGAGALDAAAATSPVAEDDAYGDADDAATDQYVEADPVDVDAVIASTPGRNQGGGAQERPSAPSASSRKRVRLLWDVENVGIPGRKSAFSMANVLLELSARLGHELWRQRAGGQTAVEPPACRLFVYHNPAKSTLSRIARKELVAAAAVLVDVGKDKVGASDLAIMSEMETVADDWDPEDVLLVLISSDTDFVDTIRRLAQRGFRVAVVRTNYAGAGSLAASSFEHAAWRVLDFNDSVLSLAADRLPGHSDTESGSPAEPRARRGEGAALASASAAAPRGGRGRGQRGGQRVVQSSSLKAPPAPPRAAAPVPSRGSPAPVPQDSPARPLSKSARARANRLRREAALQEQVEIAEEASAQASAHEAALRAQVELAEQASARAAAQAAAQAAAESERIAGTARADVAALRTELCARLVSVVAKREQAAAFAEGPEPEAAPRPLPLWLPSPEHIRREKQAQSHAEILASRIRDEIAKVRRASAGDVAGKTARPVNDTTPPPSFKSGAEEPAAPLLPAVVQYENVFAYVESESERQHLHQRSVQLLHRIKELRLDAEKAVRAL